MHVFPRVLHAFELSYMAVAMESMHFYVQLNNCRVCKHICGRVCHGNCYRIHAFLHASEQLIGFVGMSVTMFALGTVAESLHFLRASEQL